MHYEHFVPPRHCCRLWYPRRCAYCAGGVAYGKSCMGCRFGVCARWNGLLAFDWCLAGTSNQQTLTPRVANSSCDTVGLMPSQHKHSSSASYKVSTGQGASCANATQTLRSRSQFKHSVLDHCVKHTCCKHCVCHFC